MLILLTELWKIMAKGGLVMWPLLALAVLLFTTIFRLWLHMISVGKLTHPAGTVADVRHMPAMVARRTEWTLHLNRRLRFIQIMAGTAPLLGLLGTVAGMLKTFRGLSIRQTADTIDLVAVGISEALITTETGLTFGILATVLVFILREYRSVLIARFERRENELVLTNAESPDPC